MTGHLNKSDTSLWLHNKLGNVNDLWSGGSICSQLNTDVLKNIRDCFPDLQSLVKLKLLCSFLHLPRRNVELWRSELDEIVEVASIDSDQWVSIVGELCKSFPETGNINFNIDENPLVFTELIADLKKSVKKHSDQGILPIESLYLNKNAFAAQIGTQPNPVKHFTLRRKPKSAALRAELLQKSVDVATSSKKNLTTPNTATRYRGSKELNDNTPLKGIPSRTSFGSSSSISTFKTPNPTNRSAGSVRNPTRPTIPGVRRDGGIKLLDIGEQPLGRDAKRKKRNQEEAEAKQKENDKTNGQPDSTATPDYALGLTSMVPPSPAPAYTAPPTPGPYLGETSTSISTPKPPPHKEVTIEKTTPVSTALVTPKVKYEPASIKVESPVKSETITSPTTITNPSTSHISSSSIIVSPSSTTSISNAPTIAKPQQNVVQVTIVPNKQIINQQPLQQQHQQQQGSITIQPIQQQQVIQQVQRSVTQSQQVPQQNIYPQLHQQQQQQQPQQVASAVPSATGSTIPTSTAPRLQLSQKQILEAQELFKNSNTVGKVEKALILSFMGGSRENPCPHLGDIVTIKLSEKEEQIRQPDGTIINVIVENHYQMNYSTGEAKQIKKMRRA